MLPFVIVALALGAGCEKNRPPVLDAIGNQAVTAGETLEFTVTATDPDGTTPGLSATNLPGDASFVDHADGTGTFTWDTLAEDAGTYAGVVFTASDGKLSDTETITISVNEAEGEGEGEGEGVAEGEGLAEGEGAVEGEGLAEGEGEGVVEGEGEEPWEPDSFTFDVDVVPEAVMIAEEQLDLVLDSDPENHVYTFSAAGLQSAGLELAAGQPLIIHGVAIRRITSIQTDGDQVVVETEYIRLNEVITDGVVAWDYGVEFTPERIESVEIPGKGIIYPKKGTPIEFSIKVGALTYDIRATLDQEFTTIEFTVTKGLGGSAQARFVLTGELRRFRSRDTIEFAGQELQEFGHELNALTGEVTLELVVAASGQDFINLELPVPIMKIPFVVGFIPVVLNIRAQFVINASVPLDGSSRVKTKFNYNSDIGFTSDGIDFSAGGRMGDVTFGQDVNQTGASSAISVNFGVGFPRVELSIAGDSVVPWAQTAFLIGGSYTFQPACQTADALFLGAAGYNLGFFGVDLLSGSKTFFQEKKELLRAGNCPESKQNDEALLSELMLSEPEWAP
jgi:hypothetical protein